MGKTTPHLITRTPSSRMQLWVTGRSGSHGGADVQLEDTQNGTIRGLTVPWDDVVALADELVDLVERHEELKSR